MWKLNTFEGEKIFYEAELIEKIKEECKECYQNNVKYYGLALKILQMIQENEK